MKRKLSPSGWPIGGIFTLQEVAHALKKMKNKKSLGPTGLVSDMIKFAGGCRLAGLLEILKEVWVSVLINFDLSEIETVTFYKGKGDPLEC